MVRRDFDDGEFDDDDYRTGGVLFRPPVYFLLLCAGCGLLIVATLL